MRIEKKVLKEIISTINDVIGSFSGTFVLETTSDGIRFFSIDVAHVQSCLVFVSRYTMIEYENPEILAEIEMDEFHDVIVKMPRYVDMIDIEAKDDKLVFGFGKQRRFVTLKEVKDPDQVKVFVEDLIPAVFERATVTAKVSTRDLNAALYSIKKNNKLIEIKIDEPSLLLSGEGDSIVLPYSSTGPRMHPVPSQLPAKDTFQTGGAESKGFYVPDFLYNFTRSIGSAEIEISMGVDIPIVLETTPWIMSKISFLVAPRVFDEPVDEDFEYDIDFEE